MRRALRSVAPAACQKEGVFVNLLRNMVFLISWPVESRLIDGLFLNTNVEVVRG